MDWFDLSKKRSDSSRDRKQPLIDENENDTNGNADVAEGDRSTGENAHEIVAQVKVVPQIDDDSRVVPAAEDPPPVPTCETALELEASKKSAAEIQIRTESELRRHRPRRKDATDNSIEPSEPKTETEQDGGFFGYFFARITPMAETAAEAVIRSISQHPTGGQEGASTSTDPIAADCLSNFGEDEIPSKVPGVPEDGMGGNLRRIGVLLLSQACVYSTIFAVMALGLVFGMAKQLNLVPSIDWDQDINVAFVGNSYLVVNDMPRVMETISQGHIDQNSCLHTGGSLASLLNTGNGMYYRWKTDENLFTTDYNSSYGGYHDFWDWGFCSVPQLLLGYDQNDDLANRNFYNDGYNPCLQDPYYLQYLEENIDEDLSWDYVVFADQSKRMAISDARQNSINALTNTYAPLLKESGAVPVIVDTHAFWSDNSNMTGLTDVPTFQSMVYEGVEDYVQALASELPSWQKPIVAPVGLAYLTVYEEDYDLWEKLFSNDAIHSSIYGSYLFACVLYCTLFGHLPQKDFKYEHNIEYIFSHSRKVTGQASFPDFDEASYLRKVAKRVALRGYVPKSLTTS